MQYLVKISTFVLVIILASCNQNSDGTIKVTIKNTLSESRSFETVEISNESIGISSEEDFSQYGIRDLENKEWLLSQVVDTDGNGKGDLLLFQPEIKGQSEKTFEILKLDTIVVTEGDPICYSRFVPERTDDYAWENDKVAFRTYGPTAQKMKEDGTPGGTLSSGIDAWLKKVDYPIINKWYEKTTNGTGTYHEDTGEGLDNFHVGASRGIGGITVKVDSTYYFSKNFTAWNTICSGPIRTSFVLKYAVWGADGNEITEEKHISLDRGSNLSRFEIHITGTNVLTAGITLHKKEGEVNADKDAGWMSYWEPHESSELGLGIVVPAKKLIGVEQYITDEADLSNFYGDIKVEDGKANYYAGFAWKENGQYPTKAEWEAYLNDYAKKVNTPLIVRLK